MSSTSSIDRTGVVGLGTMGAGIVEVFARSGLTVVAVEIDEAALERGRGILDASVARAVEKGRMDQDSADALLARVLWTTDFADLADADLIVEAVPERLDIKVDLFNRLDAVCGPATILATNTSSLSVSRIAASTGRPGRVVGMHFFNPAPVMKLIEVITTVQTDDEVGGLIVELAERCGKTPVVVGDRAGFVANTLLIGYLNEAVRLFEESGVSRDDLDAAMRLGAGLPMGPLALCDLIGLDVVLEIVDVLFAESRDPVHAAAPMLRAMVASGLLGRKSGRGFYTYERPGSGRTVADVERSDSGPVPQPRSLALLGRTGHADELVQAATRAGLTLTLIESLDEAPADGTVLVEVSPLDALRDAAAAVPVERRPDIIGIHPLHRGPAGLAVELVRSPFTSDQALTDGRALVAAAEGTAVVCDDRAGLVVGRLLCLYLNDAARMVGTGYASASDVDAAMRLGCGYPVGPMEFLEQMGAGSIVATLEGIHDETAQGRHAPVALLRDAAAYGVAPGVVASASPRT
jgi:3-hydroxybutyryl-CoA dehydrogenase